MLSSSTCVPVLTRESVSQHYSGRVSLITTYKGHWLLKIYSCPVNMMRDGCSMPDKLWLINGMKYHFGKDMWTKKPVFFYYRLFDQNKVAIRLFYILMVATYLLVIITIDWFFFLKVGQKKLCSWNVVYLCMIRKIIKSTVHHHWTSRKLLWPSLKLQPCSENFDIAPRISKMPKKYLKCV